MKPPLLLLIVFACLLLVGCPSYSLYPLSTDQDAVSEPALEGTWSSSEGSDKKEIVFQKSSDHEYDLTAFHPDAKVTFSQITAFSFFLLAFSLMPSMMGMSGRIYFWGALVLGAVMLYTAFLFQKSIIYNKIILYSLIFLYFLCFL